MRRDYVSIRIHTKHWLHDYKLSTTGVVRGHRNTHGEKKPKKDKTVQRATCVTRCLKRSNSRCDFVFFIYTMCLLQQQEGCTRHAKNHTTTWKLQKQEERVMTCLLSKYNYRGEDGCGIVLFFWCIRENETTFFFGDTLTYSHKRIKKLNLTIGKK